MCVCLCVCMGACACFVLLCLFSLFQSFFQASADAATQATADVRVFLPLLSISATNCVSQYCVSQVGSAQGLHTATLRYKMLIKLSISCAHNTDIRPTSEPIILGVWQGGHKNAKFKRLSKDFNPLPPTLSFKDY